MPDRRPDPDALLRAVKEAEVDRRGRLKVFLGASAGVGKTYAMLAEAHEAKQRGLDVVLGFVETHGRTETEALVAGLEKLPLKRIDYRGVALEEFDVDAALVRNPDRLVVDELAHSNVPGSRHPKRWQDVVELLDAGIDVWTAVNIQHLESLNDAVAAITGVPVRETVPDLLIERADEIEVVDIPPEELRQRLREGKVYVPERIDHALEGFFRPGNLMALRELALRRAADRVDAQMRALREGQGTDQVWPARERILVAVAPSPLASRVVRSAARMAAQSHADASALYVESDRQAHRPAAHREQAREALRLAESLGMETTTLSGADIAGEILAHARKVNANLIVVGKPIRPRWQELVFGSVVDELVRRSGEIDVHVVTSEADGQAPRRTLPATAWQPTPRTVAATLAITAASIGVGAVLDRLGASDPNLVMLLLLGVAVISSRFGVVEAVVATVLSILAFNFFFVEPRMTFAVSDTQYLLTFAVMLGVGLLISTLSLRLRAAAEASAERERRTASLFALSRDLARGRSKAEMAGSAKREIENVFAGEVGILGYREPDLEPLAPSRTGFELQPSEQAVAIWCFLHRAAAGKDTDTLAGSAALYLPLVGAQGTFGVLAFRPSTEGWPLGPAQRNLLETFANTLGLALERAQLAKESHEARVSAESERLRNALLSSISHDLRTPLTAIAGAASSLVEQGGGELAETISQESVRLNHQVQNLLDMTRLQSGEVAPRLEWHVLEEAIGSALARTREQLRHHVVRVSIPSNLPLLRLDEDLSEKLFANLLENASVHTPRGTEIEVAAERTGGTVRVSVADRGPGLPPGEESALFERFAQGGVRGKGLGLGLAICQAIAKLHVATIVARNRPGGGAEFVVEFPVPATQPEVPVG